MNKYLLGFLAVLEFFFSMIGFIVVAVVFWHLIGATQLVVCYGAAPTCDEYLKVPR